MRAALLVAAAVLVLGLGGLRTGTPVHTHRAPAAAPGAVPAVATDDVHVRAAHGTPSAAPRSALQGDEPSRATTPALAAAAAPPAGVRGRSHPHAHGHGPVHAHAPTLQAGAAPAAAAAHGHAALHGHGASRDHAHPSTVADVVVLAHAADPASAGTAGADLPWPLLPAGVAIVARESSVVLFATATGVKVSRPAGPPERPPRG